MDTVGKDLHFYSEMAINPLMSYSGRKKKKNSYEFVFKIQAMTQMYRYYYKVSCWFLKSVEYFLDTRGWGKTPLYFYSLFFFQDIFLM